MSGQVDQSERRPLRTLPWWIAVLGAVVVTASATITTLWLLPIAGDNPQLRIEAIKVGLSVGAGAGGAFALLLAVRRQWLSERTQAHAEDVARATQAQAEAVARDNAYDATQRRVTGLFSQAVEQLGHPNAAVRLGGLYSLERLAQDHSEHRQTVIDVVCAYLRMPFQPPAQRPATDDQTLTSSTDDPRQELQVRQAAQRLLARHLTITPTNHGEEGAPSGHHAIYWDGMRIDLSGAHLIHFNFSRCHLYQANFTRAQFSGPTCFVEAQFSGNARFNGAQFSGDVEFGGVQFSAGVGFIGVQFCGAAWFYGAQFSGDAEFNSVQFSGGVAWFNGARFNGNVVFDEVQFSENAEFNGVQFRRFAKFGEAQFKAYAGFDGAQFIGNNLCGGVEFGGAQFNGDAWFGRAQFRGYIGFAGAQFIGTAQFAGTSFVVDPDLSRVIVGYSNDDHIWPAQWEIRPPSATEERVRLVRRTVTATPADDGASSRALPEAPSSAIA